MSTYETAIIRIQTHARI